MRRGLHRERGYRSDFKANQFGGAPTPQGLEGFAVCILCHKELNTTEAAVRSHVRAHMRRKEVSQNDYLATVLRILRRQ